MKANNSICPICGKEFYVKPSQKKKCKNNYCSKECLYESTRIRMSGENNHQYGLRGKENSSWKGGVRKSSYGYNLVYCPEHPFANGDGYVFEHRLVAEKHLLTEENSVVVDGKRYLSREYCVHHINENRTDNRAENLIVMKKGEHVAMHNKEKMKHCIKDRKGRILRIGKKGENEIPIKVLERAKKPTKGTLYSAGYDLYCAEKEAVTLEPMEHYLFDTGVAFELPENTFGALYVRSGLATKKGIMLMNGVGVIDRDFRDTVKVPLINMGKCAQTIEPNDRIAQLIITPYVVDELRVVEKLSSTVRGTGGFGSTGK